MYKKRVDRSPDKFVLCTFAIILSQCELPPSSPLFVGGMRFLKNHEVGSKFSCTNGEGVIHIGVLSVDGGQALLFISNVWILQQQYSLLCKSFIYNFFLELILIDCYYFVSSLSLVLLTKKVCDFVLQASKHEEILFLMSLFFCLSRISFGAILSNNVAESRGF